MAELQRWQGRDASFWRVQWQAGEVRLYDVVTSTNDVLSQLADQGAPALSVAVAEQQTHGRGRSGASWHAPHGSALLFSVLFRTSGRADAPGCAPIRIGLAVSDAIEEMTGTRADLKWPNDVVLSGNGKVAGILCEGVFGQHGSAHIVAGIGINVSQQQADFPPELRGSACSIMSATGVSVDRAALLTSIMRRFGRIANRITNTLTPAELTRYHERDVLNDRRVVCQQADQSVAGIARGVAQDGALRLERSGEITAVYNGTVRLSETHAYPGGAQ